jgi:hypothetical protein
MEDFRETRDILRCNPSFHGRKRNDDVIMNVTGVQFGRLEGLFRITLPSKLTLDLCLVTTFKASKWQPPTFWEGCTVIEETGPMFLHPDYLIRGALLTNTDLINPCNRYFVEDTIDNDMFLRRLGIDM